MMTFISRFVDSLRALLNDHEFWKRLLTLDGMSRFLTANAVTIVAIIMMALKIHDMFSPLRDIKGSLVKPMESEVSTR